MNNTWIIAQTGGGEVSSVPMNPESQTGTSVTSDPNNGGQTNKNQNNPLQSMWFIILIMIVMFFILFRTPQKQKQQRKKLEQSLEKNDRVLTIGGIIGTIVDIKDDEITLKVDESNNTKIKVKRTAIGRNMSKE